MGILYWQSRLSCISIKTFNLKILKQDVDKYIESDEEWIKANQKVKYLETIVDFLDRTLDKLVIEHLLLRTPLTGESLLVAVSNNDRQDTLIIDKINEVYLKIEADADIRRELGEYFTLKCWF